MALIKVGGVDLPSPSALQVGIQDIVKAERNAKATMIMELIGVKRKIEYTRNVLTAEELSTILTAIKPLFFPVTYLDTETNTFKTGTFYKGDRVVPMLDYRNGKARYKDFKISLIER